MKKREKIWIGVLAFLDTGLLLIVLCLLLLPKGESESVWENKEQQVFMEKNLEKNLAANKETVMATIINKEETDTKKANETKQSKAEEIKQQKQLINKQIKTIPDTIVKKVYGDFDGDGTYEAFVLAGSKEENGIYGKLWFVTKENAISLNVGHTGMELLEPKLRIIKEGKKSFLICDQKEVKHLSSTVLKKFYGVDILKREKKIIDSFITHTIVFVISMAVGAVKQRRAIFITMIKRKMLFSNMAERR